MTRERRRDVAFVALAASIAAHVVVMWFMRPQVMTRIQGDGARERRLPPMRIAEPPPKKAVSTIDSAKDEKPRAASPAPEAETAIPALSGTVVPEAPSVALVAPETKATPGTDAPVVETIPRLSEMKIKLSGDETADRTEVDPREFFEPHVQPDRDETLGAAVNPDDALALAMFEPAVSLKPPKAEPPSPPPVVPEPPPPEERETFVPRDEVRDKVDEMAVELEKKAVRDLLDDRRAAELSKAVALEIAKEDAADGWTYFKVRLDSRGVLDVVPKDVVILMDASGSIGDARLKSCRESVRLILRSCTNTGDRFNLVAFRDKFSYAFNSWRECDSESFSAADKWLSRLASYGRTDVFATIRSVLTLPRNPKRPLVALVVTDGDANSGVSRTAEILSRFTALNDGLVSVYMYGVKDSANRELIDMLTRGNRGESFIFEGARSRAGRYLESLGTRFRDPLLTDIRVIFAGGVAVETYPRLLKNLYAGDKVEFTGRVPKGTEKISFSIKGLNGEKAYESFYSFGLSRIPAKNGISAEWNDGAAVDRKTRK